MMDSGWQWEKRGRNEFSGHLFNSYFKLPQIAASPNNINY